jgi:hypothetical protein
MPFPQSPNTGDIYNDGQSAWRWDGVRWVPAGLGPIQIGPDAPTAPLPGMIWFRTSDSQSYVWTGTAWVIAVNPPIPDVSQFAKLPGNRVLLQRQDLPSTPTATVAFATGIDATYDVYEIEMYNVTANMPVQMAMQVSTDGGATWVSAAGAYAYIFTGYTADIPPAPWVGASTVGGYTSTQMQLGWAVGPVTSGGMTSRVWWPHGTTVMPTGFSAISTCMRQPTMLISQGGGWYGSNTLINGVAFFAMGTSFTGGTFCLYGIAK